MIAQSKAIHYKDCTLEVNLWSVQANWYRHHHQNGSTICRIEQTQKNYTSHQVHVCNNQM